MNTSSFHLGPIVLRKEKCNIAEAEKPVPAPAASKRQETLDGIIWASCIPNLGPGPHDLRFKLEDCVSCDSTLGTAES